MKPRTLAVLAVVVAALGAYVYFYERKLPSSDERKELEKKVFRLASDEVTGLTIEWKGRTVKLERAAPAAAAAKDAAAPPQPEWRLVEPFSARADRTLVERLAGDLAGLEIVRRLEGTAPKDLGLEPPRGRVVWRTASGEGTLEIGGDVPASSNLVARTSGRSEPVVVARTVVSDLDREPGDWRAKELLSAGRDEIERVRLVPARGEEVVLVRHGESFDVERPFRDAADRDAVDPLLGDLTGLRAEKFLDAPLAPEAASGLASGPGRLELALRGRTAPWVVELGAPTGAEGVRYLRADGQAVEARTRLDEALGRPATDWRSRSWSGFDSWRAERLRATDATGKLELVRDQGDWRRDGKKVSYSEVGDLLYALTSARAERVVSGAETAAYPAAGPSLTVVLADANGAEETLTLYAPKAGEALTPARVSGRDVVLLLPAKAVEEVRTRLAAVRAAAPIEEPAAPKAQEQASSVQSKDKDEKAP